MNMGGDDIWVGERTGSGATKSVLRALAMTSVAASLNEDRIIDGAVVGGQTKLARRVAKTPEIHTSCLHTCRQIEKQQRVDRVVCFKCNDSEAGSKELPPQRATKAS